MLNKYNRSFSGLSDNNPLESKKRTLFGKGYGPEEPKYQSIYTSINSQRIFDQREPTRKHMSTLYNEGAKENFHKKVESTFGYHHSNSLPIENDQL